MRGAQLFMYPINGFSKKSQVKHEPKGAKHEVYAYKKRMTKIGTIITLIIIVSLVAVLSYYIYSIFSAGPQTPDDGEPSENPLNAALVDALYVNNPNDQFTQELNETLQEAGFKLDVYQGNIVDVNFLKTLASGYELVILRMHSAIFTTGDLYLFTAEPYSVGKYTLEEEFLIIKKGETSYPPPVFTVNWGFIKRGMPERFNGTLVIAMGCDGTGDSKLIDEVLNQGALGYISWNGPVSLDHSDEATLYLVQSLYLDKLSISAAVEKTNNQKGPDPIYDVTLESFVP